MREKALKPTATTKREPIFDVSKRGSVYLTTDKPAACSFALMSRPLERKTPFSRKAYIIRIPQDCIDTRRLLPDENLLSMGETRDCFRVEGILHLTEFAVEEVDTSAFYGKYEPLLILRRVRAPLSIRLWRVRAHLSKDVPSLLTEKKAQPRGLR